MRIACLGWGSLVWNPGQLRLAGPWRPDGPRLPIEFARESTGQRITIVPADVTILVPVLWAVMRATTLPTATRQLGEREGVRSLRRSIGFWTPENQSRGPQAGDIGRWASERRLDAIIWTALQPGFAGTRGITPSADQVLEFLHRLSSQARKNAEAYVRNAPTQIDTPYRRRIEEEFGWSPSEIAFRQGGGTGGTS